MTVPLKEDKGTGILLVRSQKDYLHPDFICYRMLSCLTKRFEYKIGIKFNNTALVVKQNNCVTKIVNAYIVYDLDYWPRNLLNNLILQTCLFGAPNILKNNDQAKFVYGGY